MPTGHKSEKRVTINAVRFSRNEGRSRDNVLDVFVLCSRMEGVLLRTRLQLQMPNDIMPKKRRQVRQINAHTLPPLLSASLSFRELSRLVTRAHLSESNIPAVRADDA